MIIDEVCMHCGCARTTDTWAQRRDTGAQGLTEVTYEAGKYADQIATPEERELDSISCDEMRACAAHVLAALRGSECPVRESVTSASSRERAAEVGEYAVRVYRAVPRHAEQRAVRLALYLAARDRAEVAAAESIVRAWRS